MDRTDYQILNLLQADSRCTLRRMGDLVGLTPPAVSERIHRMEESGVIRGYHIDVDRTKLDCNITGFISVALEPDKYDKFCDFCAAQSAIISHYHVVGEFNALLRFAVRDTRLLPVPEHAVRHQPRVPEVQADARGGADRRDAQRRGRHRPCRQDRLR